MDGGWPVLKRQRPSDYRFDGYVVTDKSHIRFLGANSALSTWLSRLARSRHWRRPNCTSTEAARRLSLRRLQPTHRCSWWASTRISMTRRCRLSGVYCNVTVLRCSQYLNPATPTVAIAIKHPLPNRVKSSFVIFLTAGHSDAQPFDAQGWAPECPDVKNYKWRLNPVWHRMLYSCTHMATVGVEGIKMEQRAIIEH